MIKIKLESDIHLEFCKEYIPNLEHVDVYVLAGDIAIGTKSIPWILELLNTHKNLRIIYTLGNHEFYGENLDNLPNKIRKLTDGIDRLHFLDNDSVVINGIKFIGSTLWTDFNKLNPVDVFDVWNGINDFKQIRHGSSYHKITPYVLNNKHNKNVDYIFNELEDSRFPSILVTHHKPYISNDNKSSIQSAFEVDLSDRIHKCNNLPKLWLYGHTHASDDSVISYINGDVRYISNGLGYPHEYNTIGFKKDLILEI